MLLLLLSNYCCCCCSETTAAAAAILHLQKNPAAVVAAADQYDSKLCCCCCCRRRSTPRRRRIGRRPWGPGIAAARSGSGTWDCCCRVLLLGDEDPPWIAAAGDEDLGLGALRRSRGPGPGSAWDLGAWRRSRGGRADDGLAENFKSSDGGRRRWGYRFILGAAM